MKSIYDGFSGLVMESTASERRVRCLASQYTYENRSSRFSLDQNLVEPRSTPCTVKAFQLGSVVERKGIMQVSRSRLCHYLRGSHTSKSSLFGYKLNLRKQRSRKRDRSALLQSNSHPQQVGCANALPRDSKQALDCCILIKKRGPRT